MLIGAHVKMEDPFEGAAETGADLVQIFLGDPQSWKKPAPRADAEPLKASDMPVYVHAPYSSTWRRPTTRSASRAARSSSRRATRAADINASRGHRARRPCRDGRRRSRRLRALGQGAPDSSRPTVPVLLENTAGGDHAMARHFDTLARLWDHIAAVRHRLLPRHLPRPRRRRDRDQRGRAHPGHHRPHRPRPLQRLERRRGLRPRPAREPRQGHRSPPMPWPKSFAGPTPRWFARHRRPAKPTTSPSSSRPPPSHGASPPVS